MLINGVETTVYFVVFVLSFSRLMHVSVSDKPIDTERFIQMHDAAFRYFGGVTAECVYDQTKLVVIEELYRELTVNARFNEYATHAGFRIHACEGYDPESKGKVEAGVKYVKTMPCTARYLQTGQSLNPIWPTGWTTQPISGCMRRPATCHKCIMISTNVHR
ncbi:DDE-type integrase/transposase/recombinase [methane-oxidizing endosymbiont of Gigantopelta aegis]|uniref:DDE-type integrase/transposase/recombinase n=1 Tax=methane-oxidizing endosymbiont of Gigantopelta aegis TaxID=2794938 RepID=UPI001FD8F5EB|nr:DDE-type integrase/transposase/recombinase [methane-oxidizing endosymbiont of Gigantopelta aegis]